MKHFILFFSLLFCCNIAGFSLPGSPTRNPPPSGLRSGEQPVASIYVNTGSLSIYFNSSEGNVKIIIANEAGMSVYQTNTAAEKDKGLQINSSGWNSDIYLVTITDDKGTIIHQEYIEYY